MKNFLLRIWGFIKRHKIAWIVIVLLVGGYFVYGAMTAPSKATQYIMTTVTKGTIVSSVAGTGQVLAVNQVDVKPQVLGQTLGSVVRINVKNGQMVKSGEIMAVLDSRNALATLTQARASLGSAQANLAKIKAGATGTDISLAKLAVTSAQNNLANAQRNLTNVKSQEEVSVGNAFRTMLNSGLAASPSASDISTQTPVLSGTYVGTQTGQYVVRLYSTGNGMRCMLSGLEIGESAVDPASIIALGSNGLYIQFPLTTLHDGDSWTIDVPNTRSSNYLANFNNYQSALQHRDQAVQSAQASIDSAQTSLQQQQINLEVKQEAAQPQDIAQAQSQVVSAQASLLNAQINYANTVVRAPFDGKVAAVNAKLGDPVSGSTIIATLVTPQMYVQAPFNEVDAAKIKAGQKATITFDAIDGLSLTGTVSDVQTIGTVSQGVVNYNANTSLDVQDDRIKPGMSAHVSIITDVHTDVLMLPNAAVKSSNSASYVQLVQGTPVQNGTTEIITTEASPARQTVQVGLSNDTMTEITGGLSEGDQVVLQIVTAKTGTAQTSTSRSGLNILGGGGPGR